MNFVEPIRDRKKIGQIKNLLRGQKHLRDLLLFVVGINTALRISDLLQLQIIHFLDEQKRCKRRFWIKERKRSKRHEVVINSSIRETLGEYLAAYPGIRKDRNLPTYVGEGTQPRITGIDGNGGSNIYRLVSVRPQAEAPPSK